MSTTVVVERVVLVLIVDDLGVFQVTEGPAEYSALVFGVETAMWPVAAKKVGKWNRRRLEAAGRGDHGQVAQQ